MWDGCQGRIVPLWHHKGSTFPHRCVLAHTLWKKWNKQKTSKVNLTQFWWVTLLLKDIGRNMGALQVKKNPSEKPHHTCHRMQITSNHQLLVVDFNINISQSYKVLTHKRTDQCKWPQGRSKPTTLHCVTVAVLPGPLHVLIIWVLHWEIQERRDAHQHALFNKTATHTQRSDPNTTAAHVIFMVSSASVQPPPWLTTCRRFCHAAYCSGKDISSAWR